MRYILIILIGLQISCSSKGESNNTALDFINKDYVFWQEIVSDETNSDELRIKALSHLLKNYCVDIELSTLRERLGPLLKNLKYNVKYSNGPFIFMYPQSNFYTYHDKYSFTLSLEVGKSTVYILIRLQLDMDHTSDGSAIYNKSKEIQSILYYKESPNRNYNIIAITIGTNKNALGQR